MADKSKGVSMRSFNFLIVLSFCFDLAFAKDIEVLLDGTSFTIVDVKLVKEFESLADIYEKSKVKDILKEVKERENTGGLSVENYKLCIENTINMGLHKWVWPPPQPPSIKTLQDIDRATGVTRDYSKLTRQEQFQIDEKLKQLRQTQIDEQQKELAQHKEYVSRLPIELVGLLCMEYIPGKDKTFVNSYGIIDIT